MRCKNCGIEIDEGEIFCKECEKQLKKASSRKEVNELEELINDQIELNKLDQTKELDDLNNLIAEVESEDSNITDDTIENLQIVEDSTKESIPEEQNTTGELTREERNNVQNKKDVKKKKSKKIIIILIILLIIIIAVVFVLLFSKKNNKTEKVDYKKIIDNYGKKASKEAVKYYNENNEVASFEYIDELIKNKDYKIVCSVYEVYDDGVYLNDCTVNNEKVKYSYGTKKENKEVTKLSIYKEENKDIDYYYDTNESGSTLVGTITCQKDDCEYLKAFNKYVIVKEDDSYYLYDYESDELVFGPFNVTNSSNNFLYDKNNLYGIYYNDSGINILYSVSSKKSFANVKGTPQSEDDYKILYRYNYAIFNNKGNNDFVNLNTGNVSYSINGTIKEFREDAKNKIVYMLVYENNPNSFKVYNSNGKALFNGDEFNNFINNEDYFIVSTSSSYKIYDSKLNLKTESKTYESILGIYDDFIVVVDASKLKIVDFNDQDLATFEFDWNNNFTLNYEESGWKNVDNKKGIYLYIKDRYNSFTCYSDTKENTYCDE